MTADSSFPASSSPSIRRMPSATKTYGFSDCMVRIKYWDSRMTVGTVMMLNAPMSDTISA